MDKLHARVEYAHRLPPETAQERLLTMLARFTSSYPNYNLKHGWMDDAKGAASFEFEKPGKGKGGGIATLEPGRAIVVVDAFYKLPFFVPVMAAEWRIREELSNALKESFS